MLNFSEELLALSRQVETELSPIFQSIEERAFMRQKQVLEAFREERVSTECFNPTTGYGYDDMGREVLDRILLGSSKRKVLLSATVFYRARMR